VSTTDAADHRDLPIEQGARSVPDRATFETLAHRDDVPGQLAAEEVKLLILGVDTRPARSARWQPDRRGSGHVLALRARG